MLQEGSSKTQDGTVAHIFRFSCDWTSDSKIVKHEPVKPIDLAGVTNIEKIEDWGQQVPHTEGLSKQAKDVCCCQWADLRNSCPRFRDDKRSLQYRNRSREDNRKLGYEAYLTHRANHDTHQRSSKAGRHTSKRGRHP